MDAARPIVSAPRGSHVPFFALAAHAARTTAMGAAPAEEAEAGQRRTGNVSHIGNKHKRQDIYQKYRKEKAKRKLARRLKMAKEERAGKDGKALKKVRLSDL